MTTPLFHGDMMASLRNFYPDEAAIQAGTATRDGAGQPITAWSTVVGLEAVPCRVAPVAAGGQPAAEETRLLQMTTDRDVYVISLRGYYPTIATGMRAVIDAVNYNIISVEHDSQSVLTRLLAEIVTV